MEMSEFLNRGPAEEETAVELDVQKAVVESLAADKAEQDERIMKLQKENAALKSQVSSLQSSLEEMKASLAKVGDVLAANADETTVSNKLALLDRDPELNDRFPGETRDHVLEVIKDAREQCEKDGRLRRAQLLEGVLLANTPGGTLFKNRESLRRLFNENGNILSGSVIAELEKNKISYKNGEEYLLPEEILKRMY